MIEIGREYSYDPLNWSVKAQIASRILETIENGQVSTRCLMKRKGFLKALTIALATFHLEIFTMQQLKFLVGLLAAFAMVCGLGLVCLLYTSDAADE